MDDERRGKTTWQIDIESQIVDISNKVDDNTKITSDHAKITIETRDKVDELHEILMTIKGAINALGWLAKVAKWFAAIFSVISAGWLLWYQATHHGDVPTPKIDLPK